MTPRYGEPVAGEIKPNSLPEELAESAEVVARAPAASVNTLVTDSLMAEIERVKADQDFMDKLRALTERDREILDRLSE